MMMNYTRLMITIFICLFAPAAYSQAAAVKDTSRFDRDYTLEATMLGYIGTDGTRNPILKAHKGDRVRITIIDGEVMTHDIKMEKLGVKSKVLNDKGQKASITFIAQSSDTYFCTIPGHRAAGMVGKFEVVEGAIDNIVTIKGTLPQKNGKPLNLNFETGSLQDWTATGTAFNDGIIAQDPSPLHEENMRIGIAGRFFITSGGTKTYKSLGTLTSAPFKVTQPYAAFRVSGGALHDTRVEIVRADNDSVYFYITGSGRATLQPVVVDLKPLLNKEIYIRLVDAETGISRIPYIMDDKMAHINFDDFLFYPERPQFSNELKKEDIIVLPPLDVVPYAGLSPDSAAMVMSLPKGFKVTLAASEPDIVRPIAFAMDWRQRLWVVEANTYPVRAPEGQGKDRVYIFEDTNGDGKLDKKTLFIDNLNLVSGIEVGMGGVFIGAAPYLLFVPIDETGSKPAGPVQILLDGWGYHDTHETLNGFQWGPDGWLYGTQGVFTKSRIGAPGTPDSLRVNLNACVWRYHPVSKKFEIFAEGTSNPWGIDFNDYGHGFISACVIEHLYHIFPGGRYIRQWGPHNNPYTYDDIKTMADHVHWIGERGPHAGNGRSGPVGGGHAHAGAMVYLGGDNWPAEYRSDLFMNNIHGSRVNIDHLVRKGSGYVGKHGEDFMLANDSWSQWLNFRYDGGGSVYAIDWYDKNQCHSPNPDVHNKTLGRIFKISHEKDKVVKVDLSKATDMELVNYQLSRNDFYVRQARLILEQRGPNKKVHKALKKILNDNPDVTRQLRALWALHVTNGLKEKDLIKLLDSPSEYMRGWAIQLLAEGNNPSEKALAKFAEMAKSDPAALVRLYLAGAVQRTQSAKRWDIVEALYQHSEDAGDQNMPLMVWYAMEPLVPLDMNKAVDIAMNAKLPNALKYTVQRIGAIGTPEAKQVLQNVIVRIDKSEHAHMMHDVKGLITKILEGKPEEEKK